MRGWSRYFTWLHFKRTPRAVISTHEQLPAGAEFTGSLRQRSYWSEEGKDRHHLLGSIFGLLDEEGWRYSTDTGWNEWDIQIYGNFWWSIMLRTVTEYHGGPKCLTRAALRYRFVTDDSHHQSRGAHLLAYQQLHAGHFSPWLLAPLFCFVLFLGVRARGLKSRVAELVDLAAYRAGLQRIRRNASKLARDPLKTARPRAVNAIKFGAMAASAGPAPPFRDRVARGDSPLRFSESVRRLDARRDAGQVRRRRDALRHCLTLPPSRNFPAQHQSALSGRNFLGGGGRLCVWSRCHSSREMIFGVINGRGKSSRLVLIPTFMHRTIRNWSRSARNFPNWHKINHRDFRAIYPPGAELIFARLSRISDSPLLYKLLFTAADLATIALLLRLFPVAAVYDRRLSHAATSRYAHAAWYAWNPLVVYSFAGSAHFDSLMILPMTAGILFLTRFETETDSRRKWWLALAASAAFGVAISVKLVPVLLLLCCVFALRLRCNHSSWSAPPFPRSSACFTAIRKFPSGIHCVSSPTSRG